VLQSIRFDKIKFTATEARRWLKQHKYSPILFEPATGKQKASLATRKKKKTLPRDTGELLALYGLDSQSEAVSPAVKNDANQPVRRYKKDIIRTGSYKHPKEGWDLVVDNARMDKWIETFYKMKKNGVDVEVVRDHSEKADDVLGYTVDLFREGDKLFAIPEIIGQESIDLAERVKNVSVLIDQDFIDGTGTDYGEAITHISIVQSPIVPGQERFVPIAASRGGMARQVPLLYLGANTMAELLETLQNLIGAEEALTEETAADEVKTFLDELKNNNAALKKQIEEITEEIENFKTESAREDKNDSSDDKKSSVTMDEDTAEQAAITAEERLSLLVEQGKITPAVKEKLCSVLIGTTGSRNIMALSVKGQPDKRSLASNILDALKENDIIKLGEQTGAQVTLSRIIPDENEPTVDVSIQKEMTAVADVFSQ